MMDIRQIAADWLAWTPYTIYFAGPVVVWLLLAPWRSRGAVRVFPLGIAAFLIAWMWIAFLLGWITRLGIPCDAASAWGAVMFSAFAGIFEESSRYATLRLADRALRGFDRRTLLSYVAGHAGGESILIGMQRWSAADLSGGTLAADAVYHLVGALIVQGCFSVVVLSAIRRQETRLLFLVMLWHFGQDMLCINAPRLLPDLEAKLLVNGINFVVYPCVLFWMLSRRRRVPVQSMSAAAR